MSKIKINDTTITILQEHGQDYISLTDIVKNLEGEQLIKNWMKTKNTIDYLGAWERLNNPNFNMVEFDLIRLEAGSNKFLMSAQQWVAKTQAIGIMSKPGRYGGTYAHKDIAFHFAMWLSPEFQLLIVKEYQLLKERESNVYHIEWNFRRFLTKANYKLHTDAVKKYIIPNSNKPVDKEWIVYAEEADLLNKAVFGCTAKEWRDANKDQTHCDNIRDCADNVQLLVLANLESISPILTRAGKSTEERFKILCNEAVFQLQSLYNQYSDITAIQSPHLTHVKTDTNHSGFDKALTGLLSVPPQENK